MLAGWQAGNQRARAKHYSRPSWLFHSGWLACMEEAAVHLCSTQATQKSLASGWPPLTVHSACSHFISIHFSPLETSLNRFHSSLASLVRLAGWLALVEPAKLAKVRVNSERSSEWIVLRPTLTLHSLNSPVAVGATCRLAASQSVAYLTSVWLVYPLTCCRPTTVACCSQSVYNELARC